MGLLCWGLRYFSYYSYCRILRGGVFVPAGTDLAVKLLTIDDFVKLKQMKCSYLLLYFGYNVKKSFLLKVSSVDSQKMITSTY